MNGTRCEEPRPLPHGQAIHQLVEQFQQRLILNLVIPGHVHRPDRGDRFRRRGFIGSEFGRFQIPPPSREETNSLDLCSHGIFLLLFGEV